MMHHSYGCRCVYLSYCKMLGYRNEASIGAAMRYGRLWDSTLFPMEHDKKASRNMLGRTLFLTQNSARALDVGGLRLSRCRGRNFCFMS